MRVGPSYLQLYPEDTPSALLDERVVMTDVHLGVTPDGGPIAGAPVLEPLEHSVLEKSPDGGFTEGAPVLEPLEHSVLEKSPDGGFTEGAPVLEPLEHSVLEKSPDGGCTEGAPVLEPLEHLVPEKALDDQPMVGFAARDPLDYSVFDVDMISLWMAPWDTGGTFRIGSRPKMAIRRDRLRCVVQYFGGLAWTSVIDLHAGVSTAPVEIMEEDQKPDFRALVCQDSRGHSYGYSPGGGSMTDLGFPE